MTTVESAQRSEIVADKSPADTANSGWDRMDGWVERIGDRLNPILVKEARQALKSRQFLVTFSLLLFCGVGWSFIVVSLTRDATRLQQAGGIAFAGYYVVLSIPLLVIIPYATFQSLADERHEGTFDLLSITSLSSRQIVLGKLTSALLQMMVYYSALAPCIGFTYLLPGIDILTIGVLLAWALVLSVLLCTFSLLLAALTRESSLQVIISAALVIVLVLIAWGWLTFSISDFLESAVSPVGEPEFWAVNLMLVMFAGSFMLLFLEAASARLRFASANRSTTLRWLMLVQQMLLVGWITFAAEWQSISSREFVAGLFMVGGAYWGIMGFMLTAELGELSPRAQRDLPRTAFGMLFLTWFNPGSGTGYLFTLLNMLLLIEFGLFYSMGRSAVGGISVSEGTFGLLILGYLAFYLGLGRLAIMGLRRFVPVPFVSAVALQVLMVLGITSAPFLVMTVMDWDDQFYVWYQATNWVWTLSEILEYGGNWTRERTIAVSLVAGSAILVLLANLFLLAREVTRTRIATPRRVLEEDVTPVELEA